ncbi:MAG: hypothetical protein HN435_09520 [Nitrospinaceae bacterium]|nr:hypothetical protein [Nitrospinaceae bacterium]
MFEILSSPFFLLLASLVIFFLIVWAMLPFSLYGIRRRLAQNGERLDKINETLGRMTDILLIIQEQGGNEVDISSVESPRITGPRVVGRAEELFAELRGELRQFSPMLEEEELESGDVSMNIRDREGGDLPALILSLGVSDVQVTVPLLSLSRVFPEFSPEQFREFSSSFLHEKHGYFLVLSPDGSEFQVNIEAQESYNLDLFLGIIREHLIEPLGGNSV